MIEIAIVDDDKDDREIFAEAAISVDPFIACHAFIGGESLFDFLTNVNCNLSFIALDINMPQLNGWQILEMLKSAANNRHIPVMICSTTVNPNDIIRAAELGAHSIVKKPDSFDGWQRILMNALKLDK